MLPSVPVPPRPLQDYLEVVGEAAVENLQAAARALSGARILNLNSTAFGGGVAELLVTQVGLLNELGLDAHWQVINGTSDFFTVTKFAHAGLQGAEVPWTEDMIRLYEAQCEENADELGGEYDFVIVHDPQPAGILPVIEERGRRKGKRLPALALQSKCGQPHGGETMPLTSPLVKAPRRERAPLSR